MRGETKRNAATIKNPHEIGRVKKIKKLPWDIMSDCRNAFSNKGPSTRARTMGAPS
jgi:hypothetical protein